MPHKTDYFPLELHRPKSATSAGGQKARGIEFPTHPAIHQMRGEWNQITGFSDKCANKIDAS